MGLTLLFIIPKAGETHAPRVTLMPLPYRSVPPDTLLIDHPFRIRSLRLHRNTDAGAGHLGQDTQQDPSSKQTLWYTRSFLWLDSITGPHPPFWPL